VAPEEYSRDIDNAMASDEDDPGNWEDLELSESEADNILFAISYSALVGNDSEWTNRFYYRTYAEDLSIGEALPFLVEYGTPNDQIPVRENILSSATDETEIGWRSDFTSFNELGKYEAGGRIKNIDLDYKQTLNDLEWIRFVYDADDSRPDLSEQFIRLTPENTNSQYIESATSYAAFYNQYIELDDWTIRAGLRYDRDGFTNENLVSPRFGASTKLTDKLSMSLTAGVYYQTPAFKDLAADVTNRNLENERTIQVSAGLNYLWSDDIKIIIEPYYQQLDNLVVESDGVQQQFANTGEGTSFGIDTAIVKRFTDSWSAQFNYSYNKSEVRDTPNSLDYDADFSRPHYVSLAGMWEMSDRWKFSARWKWASGAPRDSFVVNEDVLPSSGLFRYSKEITGKNVDRFDGFSSLNFRADYVRQLSWAEMIAFVDVINLLGSDNPSSTEFNERTGQDVIEDGESIILFGLRFKW
jgi:hypothetical protein